ncbi:MAG: hypothetical protein COW15_16530 [Shewanella sp. CG12_big_fil_rev_8_21_14_0_65_47_15]|nr:MAG: hypothetical protein COW15_16530 [Shewanella sp. CG12_big_fil_rev_8_21_14_0_65_47_15]
MALAHFHNKVAIKLKNIRRKTYENNQIKYFSLNFKQLIKTLKNSGFQMILMFLPSFTAYGYPKTASSAPYHLQQG